MSPFAAKGAETACAAIAAALLVTVPSSAHADRRDLYLLVDAAPAMLRLAEPTTTASTLSQWGGSVGLTAYYGLTNEWHFGLALRGAGALNVPHAGLQLQMPDGSRPPGTLYEDVIMGGLGAVVAYRFDSSLPVAPVARAELGLTLANHTNMTYFPDGARITVPYPDVREFVFGGRLHLGLEYRFFGDRLVAGIGVSGALNLSARTQWLFEVPVTVGYIW